MAKTPQKNHVVSTKPTSQNKPKAPGLAGLNAQNSVEKLIENPGCARPNTRYGSSNCKLKSPKKRL